MGGFMKFCHVCNIVHVETSQIFSPGWLSCTKTHIQTIPFLFLDVFCVSVLVVILLKVIDLCAFDLPDLLQELNPLSLLLLPQSLSPLSLLEALTERVVVIIVHLQEVETRAVTNCCLFLHFDLLRNL